MKRAIIGIALALTAVSSQAADSDANKRVSGAAVKAQQFALAPASGLSQLGCTPNTSDPSRGIVFGCTFFDVQKFGSMGRQIATDQVFHIINGVWTNQDNNSATGGRNTRYESWDPAFGVPGDGTGGVDYGCELIPPCPQLAPTITGLSDGTAIQAIQYHPTYSVGIYRSWVIKNSTPGLADFGGFHVPDSVWTPYALGAPGLPESGEFIWPKIAHTDNGAEQVTHLLISRSVFTGPPDNFTGDTLNEVLYTRRVGATGDAWSLGMSLGESRQYRSAVIAAARNSSQVGIAWIGPRGDGSAAGDPIARYSEQASSEFDSDVYVMTSADAGVTWNPRVNVTQRPDSLPGGWAPHAKATALFDAAGVFHTVWQAMQWQGYGVAPTKRSRLFHWDDDAQIVRTVTDANWNPEFCTSGYNQLNVDNPQLSECDGKLYVTFTMFAPVTFGRGDDCAKEAFDPDPRFEGSANADLWLTVSDNNGFNWDPPRNLTDSYTPSCDTIFGGVYPDCHSDAWQSATRYGIDVTGDLFGGVPDLSANLGGYAGVNYLFVSYVDDAHPGAAILGEGGWTVNPVRVFRFGCVEKVGIWAGPYGNLPQGQAIDDPTFVLPGSDSSITWTLANGGSTDMTYTITIENDSPPGIVTVTPSSGIIPSGLINSVDIDLRLNANLETEPQNAHAEIVLSGSFFGSPQTYVIDYCICDIELLKTDSLSDILVFANNGSIGFQNNSGASKLNLDFAGDPAECDTTGNADSYLFDGSPIVSYPGDGGNIVVSSMFSYSIVDSFQFRPLGEPSANDLDPDYYHGVSGEFTTQDSTLGLISEYWSPKSGVPAGWRAVFLRTALTNRTAATINDVRFAYAWDWDVPSDSGARNTSGFDAANYIVLLRGSEFGADTGNTACIDNDRRFAAVGYYPADDVDYLEYFGTGGGAGSASFQAQYTRDNKTFVGGDWDHVALDSMLTNIVDFDIYETLAPDSLLGVDLHMVLNTGSHDIAPGDTVYLHTLMLTGIASDNNPENDLSVVWESAYESAPWRNTCCDSPGDFDNNGVYGIGDITALIAYIFSGGSGPDCEAEGDFNGDGALNISDVTAGIQYIFSGGAPPVCGPL